MTKILTRRSFLTGTAGFVAAAAFPTLARAAIPPSIYTIQQKSSGRYLDAWDDGTHDFNVVTRPRQGDASQQWLVTFDDSGAAMATIMQLSSGRYLDAHEIAEKDFQCVTRPRQTFDQTQIWQVNSVGGGDYELIQQSSQRYADAHEYAEKDFAVVTRPRQSNPTQHWVLTFVRYA